VSVALIIQLPHQDPSRRKRMNKLTLNCLAAALALHFGAIAYADDKVAEVIYDAKVERAESAYKIAIAKCDALKGNAEDICVAEAKKTREMTQGNAKAVHERTAESRSDADKGTAGAELKLAKQKCDELDGNKHDVCVKEAELKHTQAVTATDANEEVAEAHDEAHEDVSDAKYKLAMEKCESLEGDAQDVCEHTAKSDKHNY
jgi:hypothetical protein